MSGGGVQIYHIAGADCEAAAVNWDAVDKAWIACRPWPAFNRRVPAFAQLVLRRDTLVVKLTAEEPDARAVFTADNSPVHQDSCLEFFLRPAADSGAYYNFEFNPNGCMKAAVGSRREGRSFLSLPEEYGKFFAVKALRGQSGWSVCFEVPMSLLFGDRERPARMYGNFYKCGGGTERHYACWSRVSTNVPDFHRPECFGELRFL